MDHPSNIQDANDLLRVTGLKTYYTMDRGVVTAVDGVSLTVRRGEVLGLVGESGCGKSVTALSIMRLIEPPGKIVEGSIWFDGYDLLALSESEMVRQRGFAMAMIFQQPHSFLNPIFKVGTQIAEVLHIHCGDLDRQARHDRVVDLLQTVGIPDPERRVDAYPHELSGGMAQRVMIAMALACQPKLLIADEPTTALDVTIQAQILDLIRTLRAETQTSVILITHDLGIVAEMVNRVAVMYAGRIVEQTDTTTLFTRPKHPYTQGLIGSLPVLGQVKTRLDVIPGIVPEPINLPPGCKFAPRCPAQQKYGLTVCSRREPSLEEIEPNHEARCWLYQDSPEHIAPMRIRLAAGPAGQPASEIPCEPTALEAAGSELSPGACPGAGRGQELLRVEHLVKLFPVRSGMFRRGQEHVHAVNDVSLTICRGETLGLVGESGCGKTTLGRAIIRQVPATGGSVWFDGKDVFSANKRELKALRRQMQYVFQNPYASLDPRMRVGDSVGEGLFIHGVRDAREREAIVLDTLRRVGIEPACMKQFPREFSGGQRQRIGIARALALRPQFLICDEPVSALDVSIRSQVLNLLRDLQEEFALTYLFIAHDLSVVEHISDRVAVMYLGKIVELAGRDELYCHPLHPYTQALMSAIPVPDPALERGGRAVLEGDVPSPLHLPPGCAFHGRCPHAAERCSQQAPEFAEANPGHWAACWLVH